MNRECILPNTCKDVPMTFTSMTIYDVNDSEFPPVNGIYFNTIVTYAMTGHVYLYDSDGVPTLMNDMNINVDDVLSTTSKNPVQNAVITQALNQASADVSTQIAEVKSQIVAEAQARTEADGTLNERINDATQGSTEALDNAVATLTTTISTGLADKVDKVEGKGLSTNDFTDADKEKLAGLNPDGQEVPTNVSAFTNDAGYITGADVEATVEEAVGTAVGGIDTKLDKEVLQSVSVSATPSANLVSLVSNMINLLSGESSSSETLLLGATTTNAGVMSATDKTKVNNMPEFEVVTTENDPGEGSELAANKVIFVVEG